jgi:DNA-binding HxlR family transcriptional regulator
VLDENPPRVMYALTEQGATLLPLLEKVAEWGANYQAQQLAHQRASALS